MTDTNIKIVADLIEQFLDFLPEEEHSSVVIFGSSAVVLNGVDIGREVGDCLTSAPMGQISVIA